MITEHLENFKRVFWKDTHVGQQVFIEGSYNGKFRAYGFHTVHSKENRELKNPRLGKTFPQPDECLLVRS